MEGTLGRGINILEFNSYSVLIEKYLDVEVVPIYKEN